MAARHWEQNKEATIYVGNLDERFAEPLMWELMTQMGPVVNVHMPMDRVSRQHQGFGFVEFDTPESADYAARCLNGIRLYGKPIRANKASADRQRATDIGAELFVNNLDPQVDEKILYDTFAQFGRLVAAPNVVRDQNNVSKGYGFVNFDSFEASDAAREAMHGQYVLSKQIAVEYAYKKDGKGERHGDAAERKLAAEGKKHNVMPEIQPLPPAFLMNRPANAAGAGAGGPGTGANAIVSPTTAGTGSNSVPLAGAAPSSGPAGGIPNGALSNGTNGVGVPSSVGGGYPPPGGRGPIPVAAGAGNIPPPTGGPMGGPPGGFPPPHQRQPPPMPYSAPGAPPPPIPAGFSAGGYGGGGRGGMGPPPYGGGRGGGPGLPMAPNGLPARPPPGGPGGGPPGYRGGPPAGYPPPPHQQMAPPGFATGANSAPLVPPGAPGQGYSGMPPPPPPAGFGRR